MVSEINPTLTVVRVECGRHTGDRVYVVDHGTHYEYISEPLGTQRVEVVESNKLGPAKIRMLR